MPSQVQVCFDTLANNEIESDETSLFYFMLA